MKTPPPPSPPARVRPSREEVNRKAAEACGWTLRKFHRCTAKHPRKMKSPVDRTTPWTEHEGWFPPGKDYELPLPRFTEDRNALPPLLLAVEKAGMAQRFTSELAIILDCGAYSFAWYAVNATAAQVTEAALRALGKWPAHWLGGGEAE